MSRTTPPPAGAARQAPGSRQAARQFDMRQRRGQRELAAQLQERYERQAVPHNDEGPLPRID